MRSVAVLLAPLLTLLLYSGPALAGHRSSQVVVIGNHFAGRPAFVTPHSRVVIVERPFVTRPLIVERSFVARPVIVERSVFVDRQALIVRRSGLESPFIVGRTFVPQRQVFVFDSFGRLN